MKKSLNISQFNERFPNEDVCLDHLMRVRYGERLKCRGCKKDAKYYRAKERRSYACEWCGYQVYPTAGTPFTKTRTSLRDWYYVMFLFCASRNGVAAKEVQRQLGVTYKTAWRMCNLIRQYMGWVDDDAPLGGVSGEDGVVEIDETWIGGIDKRGEEDKAQVLGMIERKGEVVTRVVPSRSAKNLLPHIKKFVRKGSRVATDEWPTYRALASLGFRHQTVNHSEMEWVRGEVHTNTIEAFWANVKRGIKGTYVWVSKKHLQTYLREFEYRHNLRRQPALMFELLVSSFSQAPLWPSPKGGR
jgi:transposase